MFQVRLHRVCGHSLTIDRRNEDVVGRANMAAVVEQRDNTALREAIVRSDIIIVLETIQ